MAVQVPHIQYPFRFGANGHANVLEQDFVDEVANCCQVVIKCPVGFRIELPEFGAVDQAFTTAMDADPIVAALQRWEPRADAEVVNAVLFGPDPSELDINIQIHGREGA